LAPLWDVDRPEDLARIRSGIPGGAALLTALVPRAADGVNKR
jgi:hypothetical protein